MTDATRIKCTLDHVLEKDNNYPILCTILIVQFTLLLELVAHANTDCCHIFDEDDGKTAFGASTDTTAQGALLPSIIEEQPRPQAMSGIDSPQSITNNQDLQSAQKKPPPPPDCCTCCIPNPTPNVRANRLIAAVFLYAGVLTTFIIRIHDMNHPHIRSECQAYISKGQVRIPEPNWWVVVLFNILPFTAASFSLIRTVVDCFLVRWGQGLGYGDKTKGNTWPWSPCMPIFLVWFGVFMCIRLLFAVPIAWMMGRPASSVWSVPETKATSGEDIEMQNEETRRLVDNVDGGDADEGDTGLYGPPAYDEAVPQELQGRADTHKGVSSVS